MVIHAKGGEITVNITPEEIEMILADVGPGIPDVELAMQAGYSTAPEEVRSLGFGAGTVSYTHLDVYKRQPDSSCCRDPRNRPALRRRRCPPHGRG